MSLKDNILFAENWQWDEQEQSDVLTETEVAHNLIIWNDDVNTFDWVAKSLIAICEHTPEQAEQCTFIIHNKGKYAVKKGSFEILQPMCEAFHIRKIQATIDY